MQASTTVMDLAALNKYKAEKLVRCQQHPSKDLLIWNYTDLVQLRGPWDEVTTRTRGLVTDGLGNIVAHSFRKFHNIEEAKHTPTEEFNVFEKLDGSLGILFWHDGEWIMCSRGSFNSEQAKAAQGMLNDMYELSTLDKDLAYSFEIIYPENRIVVDYKDVRELVFLAAFHRDGTEAQVSEATLAACGFRSAKRYPCEDYKTIKDLNWSNAEGFVVRFNNGSRAKVKFAEYLALHRAKCNLNGLRIWELMMTGKPFEECMALVPDEFFQWAKDKWDELQARRDAIHAEAAVAFQDLSARTQTKAEFAKLASQHQLSTLLFLMYNKKGDAAVHAAIIKQLRPKDGMSDVPQRV